MRPVDLSRLPPIYPQSAAFMARTLQLDLSDTLTLRLDAPCNQNCVFCNVYTGPSVGLPFLKSGAVDFVLSTKMDRSKTLAIFTGGEPLLAKDLPKHIESAMKLGFAAASVQTNGVKLAEAGVAKRLVNLGVNNFFVSLHAHEPKLSQEITKGSPGDFAATARGIHNAMEAGAQVEINCVLCAANADYADEIASYILREFPELKESANGWDAHTVCVSIVNPFAPNSAPSDKRRKLLLPFDAAKPRIVAMLDAFRAEKIAYNNPRCAVPFCCVPGHVDASMEYLLSVIDKIPAEFKTKKKLLTACAGCVYSPLCFGPFEGYSELFGDRGINAVKEAEVPLSLTGDDMRNLRGEFYLKSNENAAK